MIKTAMLRIAVEFDDENTDADGIATALDRLLETAMSTPGILDEYGDVGIGDFFIITDWKDK